MYDLDSSENEEIYEDALEHQDHCTAGNLPTLLTLPREIREKIYFYTLTSSSGYVLVSPSSLNHKTTPDNEHLDERQSDSLVRTEAIVRGRREVFPSTLSPALLHTCTQIRIEASPCLFASNIAIVPTSLSTARDVEFWARFAYKLKHVWIDSGFWKNEQELDPSVLDMTLKMLHSWVANSEGGSESRLESITLNLTTDSKKLVDMVMNMRREIAAQFVQVLKDDCLRWGTHDRASFSINGPSSSTGIDGKEQENMKRVVRKLEISGLYLFAEHLHLIFAPAIGQLRDAFGGELWFDPGWCTPFLCWQDGEEKWPLFHDPAEGSGENAYWDWLM